MSVSSLLLAALFDDEDAVVAQPVVNSFAAQMAALDAEYGVAPVRAQPAAQPTVLPMSFAAEMAALDSDEHVASDTDGRTEVGGNAPSLALVDAEDTPSDIDLRTVGGNAPSLALVDAEDTPSDTDVRTDVATAPSLVRLDAEDTPSDTGKDVASAHSRVLLDADDTPSDTGVRTDVVVSAPSLILVDAEDAPSDTGVRTAVVSAPSLILIDAEDAAPPSSRRRIIWADDVGAPLVTMLAPPQSADVVVSASAPSASYSSTSAARALSATPTSSSLPPTHRPLPTSVAGWERFIPDLRERVLDTLDEPIIRWRLQPAWETADPKIRINALIQNYMSHYHRFKIGHTWVPLRRLARFEFCNHRVDRLVFVFVSDVADHSSDLETELIAAHRSDPRLLNIRPGGELTHIGYSPFFVYVAFSYL